MKFENETIATIILNVVLISTFIGIFFFTYAAKVEEEIVIDQVNIIVDDFTGDISSLVSPETLRLSKPFILNALTLSPEQISKLSVNDAASADHNKKLKIKAAIALGIILIVGLAGVFYIWSKNKDFDLKKLFIANGIILFFVGLTEFAFLTVIAKNYRTADSNFVKKVIVENIKNFSLDKKE